jgi:hypothetical protein
VYLREFRVNWRSLLGSTAGSLVLSSSLYLTGGYLTFLLLAAAGTVVGAALFGFIGTGRAESPGGKDPAAAVVLIKLHMASCDEQIVCKSGEKASSTVRKMRETT